MANMELVNVFLEGKLGKLFGRKWTLAVNSPSEAMRAIDINTKGRFREYLLGDGGKKFYKVALQKKDNLIDPKEELHNPSGKSDIYIIPTIKGASSGTGKIIAGIILVIIGIVTIKFGGAVLISAGIGLIIGGVIQLLTKIPKDRPNEEIGGGSNLFQGNSTNLFQGQSVGLVYGRALVTPLPVSMSLSTQNLGQAGQSFDQDVLNEIQREKREKDSNPPVGT